MEVVSKNNYERITVHKYVGTIFKAKLANFSS